MDYVERVAEYDSLPKQNRLEAYRKLLRETEFQVAQLSRRMEQLNVFLLDITNQRYARTAPRCFAI